MSVDFDIKYLRIFEKTITESAISYFFRFFTYRYKKSLSASGSSQIDTGDEQFVILI